MSRRLRTYGLREYGFDPDAYIHDVNRPSSASPPLGNSLMPMPMGSLMGHPMPMPICPLMGHPMPMPMGAPMGHPMPVPMGPPMSHPMPMDPMVGIPPHSSFPPVFNPVAAHGVHVHCAPHAPFAGFSSFAPDAQIASSSSFAPHPNAHYAPENPYTSSRGNATIPPVKIEELASETNPIEAWASGVPREDRELAQELKDKYGMGSRKSAKSAKSKNGSTAKSAKSKNGSTYAKTTQATRSGMEMPMYNHTTAEENTKNIRMSTRMSTFGFTFWKRSGRK
ncbi:hypothetical protein CcaverHIS002_0502080 [Cutaneotrichosporon cavernicola]|uniref:Uncharacterized protein n=1 Tax=Cutaneotrichosporon cavernicola TaxID=279322 RepID=A0AA48QWM5_9TREE|nr:uncharacterized protein CcaverHIS019_0502670 [Cutaneotrichosporon cavernicola]BEI84807.1 hypothetical protein CcaverHIS002_0502080 [Cutaneotrichosporon cavernicola]BEI92639.1 hypothetical protein CcaverHIS019_0502670 [Cutaneotrichosporon cavernicola]BEJ00413.1 hypothetical protein CcaverHIS631_0502700 [Cutaneotrichosporon cavernicola]BEJ08183.1 hypothetical protein CcaverHIS641_0502680 [Cutaneotrichosporon cavernicola]